MPTKENIMTTSAPATSSMFYTISISWTRQHLHQQLFLWSIHLWELSQYTRIVTSSRAKPAFRTGTAYPNCYISAFGRKGIVYPKFSYGAATAANSHLIKTHYANLRKTNMVKKWPGCHGGDCATLPIFFFYPCATLHNGF